MQNKFFFLSKSCYENNYIAIDQNKINSILATTVERGRGQGGSKKGMWIGEKWQPATQATINSVISTLNRPIQVTLVDKPLDFENLRSPGNAAPGWLVQSNNIDMFRSKVCFILRGRYGPNPLPALLLTPFFARSFTLVPRSWLLNRTETLATQASEIKSRYAPKFFQDNPLLCSFSLQVIFMVRTAVLRKLFDIRFSYKHCNFSRVCLFVKMASKTATRSMIAFLPRNIQ